VSFQKVLLFLMLAPSCALASGKIDILAGIFGIQASSATASSSISGVGAYALDYRMSFWNHFDLEIGYSIDASKGFGGDLAFGPDFGVLYFPFTKSDPVLATSENVSVEFQDQIKPYLGFSFHQRQYQSTESTYAGTGAFLGSEFNYWKSFSMRAEFREIFFAGPSGAKATETDVLVGVTFRTGIGK
jgi:hypothetical protein